MQTYSISTLNTIDLLLFSFVVLQWDVLILCISQKKLSSAAENAREDKILKLLVISYIFLR